MTRFLTIVLLLLTLFVTAQTINPTAIPLSTDIIRPGAGGHLWNNRDAPYGTIHLPGEPPQEALDYYFRFSMSHFFNGTGLDSTIVFTFFDARINEAIDKRQGVRWRVMGLCNNCGNPPGDNFNNQVNYAGGWQVVPQFLHNLQQAEPVAGNRDYFSTRGDSDAWIMNLNSPQVKRWIRKLSAAIKAHIDATSHSGVQYRDAIRIYDLGYYGCYSEQHSNCLCDLISELPAGFHPTSASLIEVADAQMDYFGRTASGYTNWQTVIPFNAFDAIWLNHTQNPVAYGQWLLDHPDSIGIINDHIGAVEGYDDDYWDLNGRMGSVYQGKLNNRWKSAPTGGEPVGWGSPADRQGIIDYVIKYHFSWFGNGNLDHITNASTTEANKIRTAARLAGNRLRITGGNINTTGGVQVNLNWINEGNAPTYENWTVKYLVKNGAGTTVATLTSAFNPRLFQPSGSPTTRTDNFASPAVPIGTYGLYVKVEDPTGYRTPYPLANTPRQGDGSYFLANISLGAGPSNQSPIADAGVNQSITTSTATLNGTGSSDPDGTISSYLWTQLSGPNTAGITTPSGSTTGLTGLIGGSYVFNLLVTDNNGATSGDNVTITVNLNTPPIANAGPNQVITLPTTSATMAGSGTDNIGISSYAWTKIAGPNTFVITTPSSATTTITGMTTAGVYTYRLTVTDGSGLTGFDDMNVTVLAGNQPPVANAGANQTITLPTSSVNLSGSLSSDDNGISSYAWTNVGAAGTYTINSPLSVNTSVTSLQAGLYMFRLTVTDAQGLSHTDDVQITVNAAPNTAPVANAGPNQTITLPTSSVLLTSAASTDNIGIVSRLWTKQSGPATYTIVTPNGTTTNVTGLIAGVYQFRVTVTDGSGLSSFDDVDITVNAAPNSAPIANAGGNIAVTLPIVNFSTILLDGSGSTDPGGAISTYLWSMVSGPGSTTITAPTNVSTYINNLTVAGLYTFRLRVTDNFGLTDEDDVQVMVNPTPNNAPVAEAGSPQTITLPTNFVTQVGSGTDDNLVTGYLWSQVSGPSVATISAPTSATTNFNNLVAGTYFFQLQVSDAGGLTDVDEVVITVNPAVVVPPVIGTKSHFRTNRKFLPRQ